MAITPLPTPPLRSDPTNFAARGDAFLGALPKFQVEANALAAAMNLNSTTDSSTSSITIGTGAKTFVVSSGKSFQPGMYLVIADVAAPSTNSMFGQITSYSGTSLVMSIISVRGSGTIASWIISQSSAGGAQAGPLASSGITGAAASGVNTDIISITGNAATATTSGNGSSNNFLTAGTGASGEENTIGVKCNGYPSAYLFNNEHHWGLHSAGQGGIILEYDRATGKTYMYGTATTATTATTSGNGSSNNFWTAGTGASGTENTIGVKCNGYNSAYLFNSAYGWGLYSADGGIIIEYNRGIRKIQMHGNAATATTALNAIGYEQTWLDVFSSPGRTLGVTYFNTTGKPISVLASVSTIGSYTEYVEAVVNGQVVCRLVANMQEAPLSFIVPNGGAYAVVGTNIRTWVELR